MNSSIIEFLSQPQVPSPSSDRLPCQHESPRLWFSDRPDELSLAKRYCQACPRRHACLAGALERAEATGVWGGEIFDRGRIVANKRPRGRPRKATWGGDQR